MTAAGSGLGTALLRACGLIGALLIGVLAAVGSDSKLGMKAYAAVGGLAVVAWAVVARRERLTLLFFLLVMFVEEFLPGLVVEDRTDRQLTVLYGLSFLRIPGVYPVDVLLGGLLALAIYRDSLVRRALPLLGDTLFLPLALTAGWIAIAAGISMFVFPDTTTPEAYNIDEVDIGLTKRIALLVPYMQFKNWMYVYLAYALARIHLRDVFALRHLLRATAVASIATLTIAGYRFLFYRVMKGARGSLIYDDASLFVLTLTTGFILLAWGRNMYSRRTMFWQGLIVAGCAGVIALSSRRGTTLSFALCIMMVFLLLPNRFKARALLLAVLGAALFLLFGGGSSGVSTGVALDELNRDRSAVYRLALIHNILRGDNFTLLGYGVKPLWNLPLVMGSFHFNYENVHNLFYWFILRTGIIGLILLLYFFYRSLRACWRLRTQACTPWCATLAETLFIGFVLFMFLGWFHPLYGMARFAILLGALSGTLMAATAINREMLQRVQVALVATFRKDSSVTTGTAPETGLSPRIDSNQ
ncbi:MAG: O-antigen ligase family protein [Planctomycetota bacterium]